MLVALGLVALYCSFGTAQENDSIIVPNAVLHYSIQGTGQPILLLSGGPGISSRQLSGLSSHLSASYRCILFDQRGTGMSHTTPMDSTTINLHQAMEDIKLLLKRLGPERVIIIGHSWGAMLGMSYAIKYPQDVARLVLIGPGPLDLAGYELVGDNIMSRASKAEKLLMNAAEDSMSRRTASPELVKEHDKTFLRLLLFDALKVDSLKDMIKADMNNRMQQLMFEDLGRVNYDIKEGISKLTVPLLVLCGREDPVGLFPTFLIRDLNKGARISWIEKSGHFPWVERPAPFYKELLDFVK